MLIQYLFYTCHIILWKVVSNILMLKNSENFKKRKSWFVSQTKTNRFYKKCCNNYKTNLIKNFSNYQGEKYLCLKKH